MSIPAIPLSDIRRVHVTDLECSAALLKEARVLLTLAHRRDLAMKVTPVIKATKAAVKRRRARGILPDLNEGETRIGDRIVKTKDYAPRS